MCISCAYQENTSHSLKWPKVGANKHLPQLHFRPLPSLDAKAHVAGFPEGRLAPEEDPTRLLAPGNKGITSINI